MQRKLNDLKLIIMIKVISKYIVEVWCNKLRNLSFLSLKLTITVNIIQIILANIRKIQIILANISKILIIIISKILIAEIL